MSQNPLGNSGALSHNTAGLKPALGSALASLEVQLDQELARYRRTRTGNRTQTSQPRIVSPTNFTNGGKTPPSESLEISFRSSLVKANALNPNLVEQRTNLTNQALPERSENPPTPITASDTKLPHGEQASIAMSSIQKLQMQGSTPVSNTSIVPAVIEERNKNIVESDEPRQPDDYLESSEALLRSLTEEQKIHTQTHHNGSLLSPLGIGSMLLLLLASLSVGYVAFNPKSLPHFSLGGFFQPDGNLNAEDTSVGENTKTQPAQPLTPIPKYPDLAKSEFPEVKDSNDVVGLKPKAKLVPIAPSKAIADSGSTNPLSSPQPVQPSPPLTPPTFANTESSSKPNAEIQLSKDGYYHLVTDNQGDRSFATARQVVADAYLSSDGKLIYLGAVKNKEKAKQLLHEIQAKGIKARIAQP
ncbi:MAG: hypothetical protein PUP91_28165 [Rhizonema sp. PD37]|nr:hypothetical protein [Rhizonema sp. PD37]